MTASSNTGTVSDLISAGESVFTAISGSEVSEKVASNVNDAGAVVSLVVSLVARNVTSVDVSGIVSGLTTTLEGVAEVITAAKTKTAASATTPAAS